MDSPIRLGVASLVRQRGAGDISRDEFFERLATLQGASAPGTAAQSTQNFNVSSYGADHDFFGLGLNDSFNFGLDDGYSSYDMGDSITSNEGLFSRAPFNSSHVFDGLQEGADKSVPSLLSGEEARALILGNAPWPHLESPPSSATVEPSVFMPPAPTLAWQNGLIKDETFEAYPEMAEQILDDRLNMSLYDVDSLVAHGVEIPQAQPNDDDFGSKDPISLRLQALGLGTGPWPSEEGLVATASPPASPSRPAPSPFNRRSPSPSPSLGDGPEQILSPNSSFGGSNRRSYASFDSHFSAFALRNEVWDIQRAQRCQELRRQRDAREAAECSFRPSSMVPKGRKHINGRPWSASVASSKASSSGGISMSAAAALADRLSRPGKDRLYNEALKWRESAEIETLKECTFHPRINKGSRTSRVRASSSGASHVTSSFAGDGDGVGGPEGNQLRPNAADAGGGATASRERRRPRPFIPNTNDVRPGMVNARAYLAEDVFSRLNQPSPDLVDLQAENVGRALRRSSSASGVTERVSEHPSSMSRRRSEVSFGDNSFLNFLQRQNDCDELRRERLNSMISETAPPLHPELCNRSRLIAARHRSQNEQQTFRNGTFEGGNGNVGKQPSIPMDPDCTFKPRITRLAKQRESRSCSELSTGDFNRREAKKKREREQFRQREMQGVSFTPKINAAESLGKDIAAVPGRLRVLEDPDAYLERLKLQQSKDEELRKKERNRNLDEYDGIAQCTFKPKVGQAPEFVQRMAESYRLVRNLKEKENLSQDECGGAQLQPEWR